MFMLNSVAHKTQDFAKELETAHTIDKIITNKRDALRSMYYDKAWRRLARAHHSKGDYRKSLISYRTALQVTKDNEKRSKIHQHIKNCVESI